jgi:hypothetical protein
MSLSYTCELMIELSQLSDLLEERLHFVGFLIKIGGGHLEKNPISHFNKKAFVLIINDPVSILAEVAAILL